MSKQIVNRQLTMRIVRYLAVAALVLAMPFIVSGWLALWFWALRLVGGKFLLE